MKKFYLIGCPKAGQTEEFFRRPKQIAGIPFGSRLYPHAGKSGKALHLVEVESQDKLLKHLQHFHNIYERSEIVEIIEGHS